MRYARPVPAFPDGLQLFHASLDFAITQILAWKVIFHLLAESLAVIGCLYTRLDAPFRKPVALFIKFLQLLS